MKGFTFRQLPSGVVVAASFVTLALFLGLMMFVGEGYHDCIAWSLVWVVLGGVTVLSSGQPLNRAGIVSGGLMVLFALFEGSWWLFDSSEDIPVAVARFYFFGGSTLAVEAVVRNTLIVGTEESQRWQFSLGALMKLMLLTAVYTACISAFHVAGVLCGIPICYGLNLMIRGRLGPLPGTLFAGEFVVLMYFAARVLVPGPDLVTIVLWALPGYVLLASLMWWTSIEEAVGTKLHAS